MGRYEHIFKAYAGIFFLPFLPLGVIIALLTFYNPNVGLSGLISVTSSYLFARFLGLSAEFIKLDYYIYNPLLVGLGIGFLFKVSFLSFIFIISLSILTFIITYSLSNFLSYYFKLPVLSIPFVLVSIVSYLASYKFSNLFVEYLYVSIPQVFDVFPLYVEGFLKSLGAVIFYPYPFIGAVIFLVILFYSRILAFLSILGYVAGCVFMGLMSGNFQSAFEDISAFNYILIAASLGGVFLIPHPKSYLIALSGVVASVPLVEASKVLFNTYGIPIFALPFNFIVLFYLYTLITLNYKLLTGRYAGTPEKTLDNYLTYTRRFSGSERSIALPFSGKWMVWQSFDDVWTHKGEWKYALDFVIVDEEGKTFRGNGSELRDYYAYGKPVLSPVNGIVIETFDELPDNPPGKVDRVNNWGNYVLIQDYRGFYVLICHLANKSVKVKPGDKVSRGNLIGLCGNSGYSPQPHIHIHVQKYPKIGSPTMPFVVESYVNSSGRFKDYSVPLRGEIVESFFEDKTLREKFELLIDETFVFDVFINGQRKRSIELSVNMSPDGSFYLTDGISKIYFGILNGVFYTYSYEGNSDTDLLNFYTALSKVPLNLNKLREWDDIIPAQAVGNKLLREFLTFTSSFYHDLYAFKNRFEVISDSEYTWEVYGKFGNNVKGKVILNKEGKFVKRVMVEKKGRKVEYLLKEFKPIR